MGNFNALFPGKRFKAADFADGPKLLTIVELSQGNVAQKGEPEQWKPEVHFKETETTLVLNQTTAAQIAEVTGSDDTDDWAGKRVVLFNDPSVMMGGKKVGGVRVRAPKPGAAPPPPPADDDDIPF